MSETWYAKRFLMNISMSDAAGEVVLFRRSSCWQREVVFVYCQSDKLRVASSEAQRLCLKQCAAVSREPQEELSAFLFFADVSDA